MDKFCKNCGTEHTDNEYPKFCIQCETYTWKNPLPVAVMLQLVTDGKRIGVVIGKRGIDPCMGQWDLPGGHIDCEDTDIIQAAQREFFEETGIKPSKYAKLFHSFCDGKYLVCFVQGETFIGVDEIAKFVPNNECVDIAIVWEPQELCFPSHTEALKLYFDILYKQTPNLYGGTK